MFQSNFTFLNQLSIEDKVIMEAGTKIVVTLKDGSKTEGTFVEAKAGWMNYTTTDGGAAKARAKDVEVFMTKEEKKAAAAAEKQAEKEKAAAEKQAAKDKAAAEKAAAKAATAKVKKEPVEGEEEVDTRLVPADLSHYVLHDTKTASGRKHIDIDDDTANKLRELDLPGVYKYAAKVLETTVKELTDAYQHLNPGMQRMNLGNRVRRHFKLAAEMKAEMNAEMKGKKAA